jgi:hypothetical protein
MIGAAVSYSQSVRRQRLFRIVQTPLPISVGDFYGLGVCQTSGLTSVNFFAAKQIRWFADLLLGRRVASRTLRCRLAPIRVCSRAGMWRSTEIVVPPQILEAVCYWAAGPQLREPQKTIRGRHIPAELRGA